MIQPGTWVWCAVELPVQSEVIKGHVYKVMAVHAIPNSAQLILNFEGLRHSYVSYDFNLVRPQGAAFLGPLLNPAATRKSNK